MADATYNNQGVYLKQGGNELVVANGGTITRESGSNDTFETGTTTTYESGSTVTHDSGSTDTYSSGANLTFFSNTIAADDIGNILLSQKTITQYVSSGSVLSVSVFSPGYGYAFISIVAGASKCSIKLPSARLGATLIIDVRNMASNAAASIFAASAGGNASLNGIKASDLSGLQVAASNAEGFIKLVCATEGLWSIVDNQGGTITEQASS